MYKFIITRFQLFHPLLVQLIPLFVNNFSGKHPARSITKTANKAHLSAIVMQH